MPIRCLNRGCSADEFDDLEEYHRHNLVHDVDEGCVFESDQPERKVVAQ